MLNEIQFVVERSPKNEAYARCILNNILVCCVAEEKRVTRSTAQIGSSTAASIDPTLRPSTPTAEPAELCLQFETAFKYPVDYENKARMLSGVADYTLWYDKKELMGTNLVVIEAKKYNSIGEVSKQVAAYMGKLFLQSTKVKC
jgi:hypothetical protein